MSSPAKRRKKNDFKAAESGQPVRGLEFFFAKQKEGSKPASAASPAPTTLEDHVASSPPVLNDEELARNLQAMWDEEARQAEIHNPSKASDEIVPSTTQHQLSQEATDKLPVPGTSKNTLALQSATTEEDKITADLPLDQSPLTFNPSAYIDNLKEYWAADGERATYALLTRCFVLVNATTSRIKIVDTLVNLLRIIIESDPASLAPAVSATRSHLLLYDS